MIYRVFGRTGLRLPVYSLGGMRFMQSWDHEAGITPTSDGNVHTIIHHALSVGINHIDTARGYGTSERQIGRVLKDMPRDKYLISTKVTPKSDSAKFIEEVRDSVCVLACDYLDILHIHGVNNPEIFEQTFRKGGAMDTAEELRREGLVRHIGFSTHGDLDTILRTVETGRMDCVMLHYYFLMPRNLPALQAAAEHDMGISIISPADKGGQLYRPSQLVSDLSEPYVPLVLSDLFCLTTPGVHTVNIGARRPSDVDSRLAGLDHLEESDRVNEAANRIIIKMRESLGSDFCTGCHKCEPCPEGVNIPETLRLRNLAVGLGLMDFALWRFNMFEEAAHWFPGRKPQACTRCGECLPRCPENLDIPELVHDTVGRLRAQPSKRLGKH